MKFLTNEQKRVLDDFIKETSSLIEHGFAYSMAHEEYLHKLDCNEQKIRLIESVQRTEPRIRNCYNRMLQQEYMHYILNLVRAGLKSIKNNPNCFEKIARVQKVMNDYGKLIKNSNVQLPAAAYFKEVKGHNPVSQYATKREPLMENYQTQNQTKQYPIPVKSRTVPARQSPSTDDNNAFKEIADKMKILNNKIDELSSRTYEIGRSSDYSTLRAYRKSSDFSTPRTYRKSNDFLTSRSCERSSDCLRKFHDELSKNLFEIQSTKKTRMRQQEKAKKFDRTMPTRNLKNYFDPVIRDEDGDIEDSYDEPSSEVIINNETFIKSQPARIGRIERSIVIPIHVDENQKYPNMKPYAYFEEAEDGSRRINVLLEFDEKVLCNDKLVNQIKFRNLLTK